MYTLVSAIALATVVLLSGSVAEARNDRMVQQIVPALAKGTGGERVDRSFPVVFGTGPAGAKLAAIEARGKSQAAGATPEEACGRAFRDAVTRMQAQAKSQGAAAVGNVVSQHGAERMTSSSTYLCAYGNVQVVVVLTGATYGKR